MVISLDDKIDLAINKGVWQNFDLIKFKHTILSAGKGRVSERVRDREIAYMQMRERECAIWDRSVDLLQKPFKSSVTTEL